MTRRIHKIILILGLALGVALPVNISFASSRLKDIADFEGVRENLLVGYGLVVGINGTGDTLRNSPFTRQSLEAMLERMGVNIREANVTTDNIAAVMVTANLPAFSRQGSRIDVAVSAIGNAKSLQGGTLLVTPLMAADGEVYAVAQGPVVIGGFSAKGQAQQVTKGVPTSGRIASGAIVEREVGFELASMENVRIALRNPDLTTARRISQAVNAFLGTQSSRMVDPGTVTLMVPPDRGGDVAGLLGDIEQLQIEPDQIARVVVDENNGIIVMGKDVRVSTVAIAQGNLTIRITETPQVSQPLPFSPGPGVVQSQPGVPTTIAPQTTTVMVPRLNTDGSQAVDRNGVPIFDPVQQVIPGTQVPNTPPVQGQIAGGANTVVVPRTQIDVDEQSQRRLAVLNGGVSLGELVNGLNALGIGPRDMISILQTVKAAGALQAEIVVR